jgi:TPR repeat protein
MSWHIIARMNDLKKKAESGDVEAQNQLAAACLTQEPPDFDEAVKWLRMAADQGDAGAQNNLGVLYMEGDGVKQGFKEAAKLFRKAAEQGIPSAQANLGSCYAGGSGVEQSWEEAYFWWSLAFEEGEGAELLAEAVAHLTPEQKAAADKRIAEWKLANAI